MIYESNEKYPIGIISQLEGVMSSCKENFDRFVLTEQQKERFDLPVRIKEEYNKEIKNEN